MKRSLFAFSLVASLLVGGCTAAQIQNLKDTGVCVGVKSASVVAQAALDLTNTVPSDRGAWAVWAVQLTQRWGKAALDCAAHSLLVPTNPQSGNAVGVAAPTRTQEAAAFVLSLKQ